MVPRTGRLSAKVLQKPRQYLQNVALAIEIHLAFVEHLEQETSRLGHAAILTTRQLREYRQQAESLGMDVLVEVHNEPELASALDAGSRLIGVNNRNLNDFSVSLETTFRLRRLVPDGIPVVSESGISTIEDIRRLKAAGVKAALIGESLMRAGVQDQLLKEFLAA